MKIHKTAIINPKAEIDSDVEIGPFCIVDEDVRIGNGTKIMPYVHIFLIQLLEKIIQYFKGQLLGVFHKI